ncbi:MAG TPA: hypothetical protein VGA13_08510 [Acidimicrobiales bacterium]
MSGVSSRLLADVESSAAFRFVSVEVDGASLRCEYAFDDVLTVSEQIVLPAPLPPGPATDRLVRAVHLAAGVSYYKVVAPRPLVVETGVLDEHEAALVAGLYDHGLRELAVTTGLDIPVPVDLSTVEPRSTVISSGPSGPSGPGPGGGDLAGALVPVGGGKDSALVADLLPGADLITVNAVAHHRRFADALGRPLHEVVRHLDPVLRDLNDAGARNGHVPITAIVATISAAAALALGRRDVVLGIERSASEPTRHVDEHSVNHQWSKSFDAELLLHAVLAPSGVRLFSLLRPLSEAAIAAEVARRGLVGHVLSCNQAFTRWRETEASRRQTWCANCPKCRFAHLVLAPHLEPPTLLEVFGADMLDDPAQVEGFRDLFSVENKPFECVGDLAESAISMAVLAHRRQWSGRHVVKTLATEAAAAVHLDPADATAAEAAMGALLRPAPEHRVPADYQAVLDDLGVADAPR